MVGIVDEVGADISQWKKGQRAGVGWHGGHDNTCRECRRGDFRNCRNLKVPGISYDGGYQQYMLAPEEAVVAIPETLRGHRSMHRCSAPGLPHLTLCGTAARCPATLSRFRGIGGLGHLGIQFANKFGYKVVAIGRGPDTAAAREEARGRACTSIPNRRMQQRRCKNWAAHGSSWPPPQTRKLCPNSSTVWDRTAKLIVIGVSSDPIEVTPIQLITRQPEIFKAGLPEHQPVKRTH